MRGVFCKDRESKDYLVSMSDSVQICIVTLYSFGEYTSMDIDLIDQSIFKHREIKKKMLELGFVEEGKHFRHPPDLGHKFQTNAYIKGFEFYFRHYIELIILR